MERVRRSLVRDIVGEGRHRKINGMERGRRSDSGGILEEKGTGGLME